MKISSLLTPKSFLLQARAKDKIHLFQDLSVPLSRVSGQMENVIVDVLLQREHLGTTGIGQGIALPHGRFLGLEKLLGFFIKMAKPIDFQSFDGVLVDIIFVLLIPERAGADHLRALASVARLFRDAQLLQKIRAAEDEATLYALLTNEPAIRAA